MSPILEILSAIVKTLSADVWGHYLLLERDTVSFGGDTTASTILGDTPRRIPPYTIVV